jgi:hypothetical protein
MRFIHIAATVAALAFAVSPALAGKGGNGNGHGSDAGPARASCSVSGSVVSATGLPTDQVINFMVNDSSGNWGWVLGMSDGSWSVSVPAQSGPTTYQFVSKTWGPDGSKYDVFASCS